MNKPKEMVFTVPRGTKVLRAFKKGDNGDLVSFGVSLHPEELPEFIQWINEVFVEEIT